MAKVTQQDWIDEGLTCLVEQGQDGLAAENLARRLGVTRGSFYHHFEGREAYLRALLDVWEERQTAQIIEISAAAHSPKDRLDSLLNAIILLSNSLDAAVHAWSLRDPLAREYLARVDSNRIKFVAKLYQDAGKSPDDALFISRLSYYTFVGMQQQAQPLAASEIKQFLLQLSAVFRAFTTITNA